MATDQPVLATSVIHAWDTTRSQPKPVVLTQLHEPLLGYLVGLTANDEEAGEIVQKPEGKIPTLQLTRG